MLLIDTNVLSEALRRQPNRKVYARLLTHAGNLAASVISLEELRFGAILHATPHEFWRRVEEEVLPLVNWIPVDKDVALAAAEIRANLSRSGKTVAHYDCIIAGTATVLDCILITRNTKDFISVPGLQIENWFE